MRAFALEECAFKLICFPCSLALDSWPSLRYTQRCCQSADSLEETGAHFHAQAHISTQPPPPCENARVPGAHEDQGRRCRVEPPPCNRPQARISQRRLPRLILPRRLAHHFCSSRNALLNAAVPDRAIAAKP